MLSKIIRPLSVPSCSSPKTFTFGYFWYKSQSDEYENKPRAGGGIFPVSHVKISKVVRGDVELGAGNDIGMGLLSFESHNPDRYSV